jgi:hypothetical protein
MTSNTLERDEPLKEDVLESKVPKNDEGRWNWCKSQNY